MPDWFSQPGTICSSGLFICEPLIAQFGATISSPFVQSAATPQIHNQVVGAAALSYRQSMAKSPGVFVVQKEVLKQYAEKLLDVARIIKESTYNLVLCPMRGARLAGIQSNLICHSEAFAPFDGAGMAQNTNDERILNDLRALIGDLESGTAQRRFGVLDTAIGGDSCTKLAQLLRILNDEASGEQWSVQFHLIYAAGRYPGRSTGAYAYQSERMSIEIREHEVLDLLIEDEARVLGYDVERGGGGSRSIRFQQDGQLLVWSLNETTLYQTAPLDEAMIAMVSEEIKKLITDNPDIHSIHL